MSLNQMSVPSCDYHLGDDVSTFVLRCIYYFLFAAEH